MAADSVYPFSELLPLLKFPHPPPVYQEAVQQRPFSHKPELPGEIAYQQLLPRYLYARCPICGTACEAAIDTCALPLSAMPLSLGRVNPLPADFPNAYNAPCHHYVGTHDWFIHLHEHLPVETTPIFSITYGEVPYVTPRFLPDNLESYVILHALPVCRIIENQFVPRYTRYILTYFCTEPRRLINQIYADQPHVDDFPETLNSAYEVNVRIDPPPSSHLDFIPASQRAKYEARYDLQAWANRGRLGCLDFRTPELPLRIRQGLELPPIYQHIFGRRYRFLWDGENRESY